MSVLGLARQGTSQCCEAPQKVTLGQGSPGGRDLRVRTMFKGNRNPRLRKFLPWGGRQGTMNERNVLLLD